MANQALINRRDFIKAASLAGGGLLISIAASSYPVTSASTGSGILVTFNPFLQIGSDNSICVILSKVEMGQGIWTTLPMLIAEELDCDLAKIKVQHSPPGVASDFTEPPVLRSTGGSETTLSEFDRYRLAGAMARQMLINTAARRLHVSPESCLTKNSFVLVGSNQISYGELAEEASKQPVPEVKLRLSNEWRYIGKTQRRLDNPEKINGSAKYGIDIQFPELLTAVVAHAPAFGAKIKSFDDTACRAIKGVKDVIEISTGIAVLAEHFWAAKTGRDALKVEWDVTASEPVDSESQLEQYRELATSEGRPVKQKGDVVAALASTSKVLHAQFRFPYLAHAPMEPLNCTVKISDDHCYVWAGTQSPLLHQAEVAAFLGLKPEQVSFNTPYLGGSFGRRGSFSRDWVMEAVTIAKISGKFIKLIWSREDDIKGGYYRPVYLHQVQIGIGNNGYPHAWQHRIVGQSLFAQTPLEGMIVQNGIDYSSVTTGAPYSDSIENYSFELHTTTLNIPVLPWRSVGSTHCAFVMETLIDELAAAAGKDPVQYRTPLLVNSPRHAAVLKLAVEKADWNSPMPKGRYRGIALHAAMGSYVCQVVELSIEEQKIHIHRVVCVIDCGLAVNPDGVRAQMEGGIIYGVTAALYGEITLNHGSVQQSNFNDYKMLRMNETPGIEVHILDSREKMGGAGEPGVPPIAPALANALFAATGKRVRRLPINLEELR